MVSWAKMANEPATWRVTDISARHAITAREMMPAIAYASTTDGPAMLMALPLNRKKPEAIVPPTDSMIRWRTWSLRLRSPDTGSVASTASPPPIAPCLSPGRVLLKHGLTHSESQEACSLITPEPELTCVLAPYRRFCAL